MIRTCAILTADASRPLRRIHRRMPVILHGPGRQANWLIPLPLDVRRSGMYGHLPDWEAWPVSRSVNSPRNEGVRCTKPVGPAIRDGR